MEKTINPKYDIGQMVNATLMNGKTYKGRIHMIRAEWSPYGSSYHYDITMDYDKELDDWYVANLSEKQIEPLCKEEQAERELAKMSLEDCIKMWNESTDQFHQLSKMQPMENEGWWNHLAKELGAWDLMHFIWNSGEDFNDTDKYFMYEEDGCKFFSFSTKQELLEAVGKDMFIEELINREEK